MKLEYSLTLENFKYILNFRIFFTLPNQANLSKQNHTKESFKYRGKLFNLDPTIGLCSFWPLKALAGLYVAAIEF